MKKMRAAKSIGIHVIINFINRKIQESYNNKIGNGQSRRIIRNIGPKDIEM